MIKKLFLVSLLFLVLSTVIFKVEIVNAKDEVAPDFKVLDLNGNIFTSKDLKGKPAVLFFWTTWCPYCRKELSVLEGLYPNLVKERITLLTIDSGEPNYRVSNFVKSRKLNFTVALDENSSVAESFDILGVPTYVLIDRDGRIRFKHNYFPLETYKDLILKNK